MAQWKNTLQRIEIGGYDFCSFTQAQKDFAMCLIKMAYNDGLEQAAADIISKWSAKIIESRPNYIKIAIPYNWRIGIGIFGRTVVFNANKKMVASWDGNLRTPFRQY